MKRQKKGLIGTITIVADVLQIIAGFIGEKILEYWWDKFWAWWEKKHPKKEKDGVDKKDSE